MTRIPPVEEAARILSANHVAATINPYGAYVTAGFAVTEGAGAKARVTHAMPNVDLLDADRRSDDDMAAERHRMVNAYAAALEASGWIVEKRAPRARYPFLLASRP